MAAPVEDTLEQDVEPRSARLPGFLAVCLQLLLILAVVRLFDIGERNHFFFVLACAVGGFVIHAWLPTRWRLWFFSLLSMGTILFVLGWPDGVYLLGVGGVLIALCHLPVAIPLRAALLVLAGLGLALTRLESDRTFWPLLGSMFMFRLIVYLYELRHRDERPDLGLTLAYFFPLPNVSFLFFPILDFKTFRTTYQAAASWTVAQEGITWMVRGVSHLLAYRFIKYYILPAPHELGDVPHLALFLAANYALYLHVSGYFHLITGILHLFGFRLPPTHHYYFLASSFTDIWRRINIYWKDFMTKLFFLPAFFALGALGTRGRAAAATLFVFLATWLLHAYQVFWLTGTLTFGRFEAGLWFGLGILVALNLQFDLTRAAHPGGANQRRSVPQMMGLALRVVAMFVLVSFFWACWNTPAVLPIVRRLALTDSAVQRGLAKVCAWLLAAVVVGTVVQLVRERLLHRGLLPLRITPYQSASLQAVTLGLVLLTTLPQAAGILGTRGAEVVTALRRESATPAEAAQLVQGYYEEVTAARVPAGMWLAMLEGRPKPPTQIYYTDISRPADDLLERELIPNWSGEVAGSSLSINRYGMRDRADLVQKKPAGTCRIALLGSSVVMGYGVNDDEVFARLVENDLNTHRPAGTPRYELLNFGTGMSFAIQRRVLFDRKIIGFEPDALYWFAHQDEFEGTVRHLTKLIGKGTPLPYPRLQEIVQQAGITRETPPGQAMAQLQPHARAIVVGLYKDLVQQCRQRGILPVWIYLPMPGVVQVELRSTALTQLAEDCGFATINLADWAAGHRPSEVKLGEADPHANALGHRLIAEKLAEILQRRPELLPCRGQSGK